MTILKWNKKYEQEAEAIIAERGLIGALQGGFASSNTLMGNAEASADEKNYKAAAEYYLLHAYTSEMMSRKAPDNLAATMLRATMEAAKYSSLVSVEYYKAMDAWQAGGQVTAEPQLDEFYDKHTFVGAHEAVHNKQGFNDEATIRIIQQDDDEPASTSGASMPQPMFSETAANTLGLAIVAWQGMKNFASWMHAPVAGPAAYLQTEVASEQLQGLQDVLKQLGKDAKAQQSPDWAKWALEDMQGDLDKLQAKKGVSSQELSDLRRDAKHLSSDLKVSALAVDPQAQCVATPTRFMPRGQEAATHNAQTVALPSGAAPAKISNR